MKQKLVNGTKYVLMAAFLLAIAALLLLAASQVGRFYRPLRAPVLERLGLPGIALALLALAAILFAFVARHPRRLLAVGLLGLLAFVALNLASGRHVLPQALIWPSPSTLAERYVQALAANDLDAALQLAHPSHECHQLMIEQFSGQQAQLAQRLGDGWSESGYRQATAKRITFVTGGDLPQQLVHVQVETEAGRTAWLTLSMRTKSLMGARTICGTGIDA